MMEFILQSQNLPFTVALVLMFFIAALEGVSILIGFGLSGLLESIAPDFDMDVDIDGADVDSGGGLTRVLGWLRFGQVPVLILMILFLTAFGLIGLGIQSMAVDVIGGLLPMSVATIIAFVVSLPMVRFFGGMLTRVMPKDETEAVTEQSFIGLVATITLGTARYGQGAQGKLKDRFGQAHYVMIEPDNAEEQFEQGTSVVIVQQKGAIFTAIANPSAVLEEF